MPTEFRMPSLGPDMESGTLVQWRVKPGDSVKRGDVIAVVETQKGVIDVEVFATGTISRLLVEPGSSVPVGTVLAELDGATAESPTAGPPLSATGGEVLLRNSPPVSQPPPSRTAPRSSPAARARARELDIDLDSVEGTGPDGAITLDDVLARSSTAPKRAGPQDIRDVIARAMSRSKREIPHYYLSLTCELTALQAWLDAHNSRTAVTERMMPSAFFIAAVARAAVAQPGFSGHYGAQGFVPATAVHAGMAIALRGGRLVAPAILDADRKPAAVVMKELRDLTSRVRSGHVRGSELSQATVTVTSLGEDGVDAVIPVIHPPQVAIVGFGTPVVRPWVIDGAVGIATVVTISLAADHRVTDGRAGARFLRAIRDALQSPEGL